MKPANDNVSIARLRELLQYNPISGSLTYRVLRGRMKPGDEAGTRHKHGYIQIRVDGFILLAHRVAWAMHTGSWPNGLIDHRDGIKHRNVFENLRDTTSQTNQENMRRARCDSSSGLLGAHKAKGGKWDAKISLRGKTLYLGTFDTAEQAHSVYLAEKRRIHAGGTI